MLPTTNNQAVSYQFHDKSPFTYIRFIMYFGRNNCLDTSIIVHRRVQHVPNVMLQVCTQFSFLLDYRAKFLFLKYMTNSKICGFNFQFHQENNSFS